MDIVDATSLIVIVGACLYLALVFLHGGSYGLAEDLRVAAGFPVRDSVDTVKITESDMQVLKRNYSGEREKMWAGEVNESGFIEDLQLIGVGNYSRVEADSVWDWKPDVLIHSHPLQGSAWLSPFDKEMLFNRSRQVLDVAGREDVFSMSCILHRKWRFVEPGLYCYGNPFYYRDTEVSRISEGGLLNRVDVTVLD
jgi:hypothetical protein